MDTDKTKNQCQGCQAGWEFVEHKPWPKGSKSIRMHKVKGGYPGELVCCEAYMYGISNKELIKRAVSHG